MKAAEFGFKTYVLFTVYMHPGVSLKPANLCGFSQCGCAPRPALPGRLMESINTAVIVNRALAANISMGAGV
jgi:hypothetical protein